MSGVSVTLTRAEIAAGGRESARRGYVVSVVYAAVMSVLLGVPFGLMVVEAPGGLIIGVGLAVAAIALNVWFARPARLLHHALQSRSEGAHDTVRIEPRPDGLHLGWWWGWRRVPWDGLEIREERGFLIVNGAHSLTGPLAVAADREGIRQALAPPAATKTPEQGAEPPVARWNHTQAEFEALRRHVNPLGRGDRTAAIVGGVVAGVAVLGALGGLPLMPTIAPAACLGLGVVAYSLSWWWFPEQTLLRWLGDTSFEPFDVALHLRPEGLLFESGDSRTLYRWRWLTSVTRTRTHVFVGTAGRWGVIPRPSVDDWHELRWMLQTRAKEARSGDPEPIRGADPDVDADPGPSLENPFEPSRFDD